MATINDDDVGRSLSGGLYESNEIHGNGGDDDIFGGYLKDFLYGGNDNDQILGDDGDDFLDGGIGSDTIYGGNGDDTFFGEDGDDSLFGGNGSDYFNTGAGMDYVDAGIGDDIIYASYTGPKTILGGSGDDLVYMGPDTQSVNGETGVDLVSYIYATAGVTVDLRAGTGAGWAAAHTYKFVEDVNGTAYNDFLIGNGVSNVLFGDLGDDRIRGGYGADFMDGGDGLLDALDYLDSTAGVTINLATGYAGGGYADGDQFWNFEQIYGSNYDDSLTGNSAANVLNGGAGADTLTGGLGNDFYVVDYYNGYSRDRVFELNGQGTDMVQSSVYFDMGGQELENLTLVGTAAVSGIGNSIANYITGNSAANTLNGLGGNDTLGGASGNDTLSGGDGADILAGRAGADTLTGGIGADRFDYNSVGESTVAAAGQDVITQFLRAEGDKIDLAGFDWSSAVGDQAFSFVGTAAFTGAGQVRYAQVGGDTFVYANVGGDLNADFAIKVTGLVAFQTTDFVL